VIDWVALRVCLHREAPMRPLTEMSFGQRFALTIVICLVILFALALFGYLTGGWDRAEGKVDVTCIDPVDREMVRGIMLAALDKGLSNQTEHLFETWMKDNSDQPRRAAVGANNAVNAWIRSRKSALAWDPPSCSPEK
jgi:hypothetical protein